MFEIRNYWYPKEGKVHELRDVLVRMAAHRQAQGQMTSVSEQLFSAEGLGGVLIVAFYDRDLAGFQQRRHHNQTSPDVGAYLAKAHELSRNQRMEIYEVLVPFPDRKERNGPGDTSVDAPM